MKTAPARQETPLISIIIPAFKIDIELRRCIDSVRTACPDPNKCEIIVVVPPRELSKDDNLLIGERLIAESHPSIYGAMNDGISASAGRYMYFLGKDDIVLPRFREALDRLESSLPSALFFDVYWGAKGIYSGRPSRLNIIKSNLCHQGIIYSRETIKRWGPYVRKMKVQADHLLNIRLLWDRECAHRFEYINMPLTWYSDAGFSSQNASDPTFWRLYPLILEKYVGKWAAGLLILYRKLRSR